MIYHVWVSKKIRVNLLVVLYSLPTNLEVGEGSRLFFAVLESSNLGSSNYFFKI